MSHREQMTKKERKNYFNNLAHMAAREEGEIKRMIASSKSVAAEIKAKKTPERG